MAQQVLAKVESYLHSAPFYTIMVDETTDISNHEQVVVCIRWVDNSFEAHEELITLEMACRIDADPLVSVIKGVLKDHNLSVGGNVMMVLQPWPVLNLELQRNCWIKSPGQ